MVKKLEFQLLEPEKSLSDFIYCFSALQNFQAMEQAVIFPNGKVDLVFLINGARDFSITLLGLETKPKYAKEDFYKFFSVSFHPLAIEYVFNCPIADIVDTGKILPDDFWGFSASDMDNFEDFQIKATRTILELLPARVDERKRQLFNIVYETNGEIPVAALSERLFWSARQINRYFSTQFGLSLKQYCKIIRFQASLQHISGGELYSRLNFTDQSHFIKEIKKLSGVSPKELYKNENDRFLQFLSSASK
ncbi:AraC family transcriptional regulator [Pedobacter aquatilis]|uniref:AraC family transcriptional regulator n=1 Tax=Pedobacter aquatilis TaxID=351343 RepID=UPI00292FC61D|nr:AraC family transcriptional regulator [Pedobacter aquatilis]